MQSSALAAPPSVVACGGQALQKTVPDSGWYWLAAHSVQFAASLSRLIFPAGHAEHRSGGAAFPAVSSLLRYVPGAHGARPLQTSLPTPVWNLPAGHSKHSLVFVPGGKNLPAGQINSMIAVAVVGAVAVTVMLGGGRFWAMYTCWIMAAMSLEPCTRSANENAAASGAGVAAAPEPPKLP